MEPIDAHLLAQTILYFLIFVCGFIISIPLGVSQIQFDNSCLLYAHFEDGILQKVSSSNNCNFPLYMSVVGCILCGLAIGSYYVYALIQSRRSQTTRAQMWVLPYVITNTVMALMSFIAACMISVGFKKFCNGLLKNHEYYTQFGYVRFTREIYDERDDFSFPFVNFPFWTVIFFWLLLTIRLDTGHPSMTQNEYIQRTQKAKEHCSDAEGSEWHNEDTGKLFHPGHYYRMMNISQIACWIVFLLWVAQLALGFLRFFRNRKLLPKGTQSASPSVSTII